MVGCTSPFRARLEKEKVIVFILWFLEGFWKGLSELVNDLLGTSKK